MLPQIIILPQDIACTSPRVKKPLGDSFKPWGDQSIPRRGIATSHHGNVCSQAEITNLVEISTLFYFPAKNVLFLPDTLPVVLPSGRYFEASGWPGYSSVRLSILPRVILSITILEFPANSGGFPQRDFTFLQRNKGISTFPKMYSFLDFARCFAKV